METKVLNQNGKSNDNKRWQKVMIAGIPAIALGGAAGAYASTLDDNEEITTPDNTAVNPETATAPEVTPAEVTTETPDTEYPDIELAPLGDIQVATNVNDDMSFDQAFAAAREEVGPGGVFEWHGGVYGTYHQTEWDAMSDDQKAEFSNEAIGIPYKHHNDGDLAQTDPLEVNPEPPVTDPDPDVVVVNPDPEPDPIDPDPEPPVVIEPDPEPIDPDPEPPVVIEPDPDPIDPDPEPPVVIEPDPDPIDIDIDPEPCLYGPPFPDPDFDPDLNPDIDPLNPFDSFDSFE